MDKLQMLVVGSHGFVNLPVFNGFLGDGFEICVFSTGMIGPFD